ncbi:flagellar hook-associated protein FlgL [Bacillaceae bacterium W0354]
MRITQSMLNNNMLRNISQSYTRMDKYMNQLSTGKKINRPSDDPVAAMKGISYRSELSKVKQFDRNISEVHSWMENTDDALDQSGKALQRIRELIVQASNDTYEENQRNNISEEIEQLKEHLMDLANTKVNNKHIFSGTNTTEPMFINGTLNANSNDNPVYIEVSDGIEIRANIEPSNVFNQGLFDKIDEIVTALEDPNTTGDALNGYIDDIDGHFQDLVNERADLGARMNRVDLIEDRLGQLEVSTTKLLSSNEDADIEEVIMNLVMQESVHRAALGAGARILQPSLIDFLR